MCGGERTKEKTVYITLLIFFFLFKIFSDDNRKMNDYCCGAHEDGTDQDASGEKDLGGTLFYPSQHGVLYVHYMH